MSCVACVLCRVSHADQPEGDRNLDWWGQATESGRCAGSRTGAAVKPACALMCEEARSFLRHEIAQRALWPYGLGGRCDTGLGNLSERSQEAGKR